MKDKIFKTYREQKDILIARGMIISRPHFFFNRLREDDYYNLINGYKAYFIARSNPEIYVNGTTFEQLYSLYEFDREIRILFLGELIKIEKHIKSLIAYHFSELYGHDHRSYLDVQNFKNDSKGNLNHAGRLIKNLQKDIESYSKCGNTAICHYLREYGYVPLWVLNSTLSFGRIAHFYSCMKLEEQQLIASHFNMSAKELDGFIYFLGELRNICAHGARVYTQNHERRFLKIIPDTKLHAIMNIPKNNSGNYIAGKSDVLAAMITFKFFCSKSDFRQLKKKFHKAHKSMERIIPKFVLDNIDNAMGISQARLSVL